MKAARLYHPYDLRVEEVPDPGPPAPGWVRLRIAAVGICGSDLHYYREGGIGTADVESPLVMGHEFSAYIDELGPGVQGLEVGQLVAVEPGRACGKCESCQQGNPNVCPHIIFCGYPGIDGALQEYLLYPAEFLYPLPEGFTPADGAMLEPLGVGLHAVRLGKLRPGETAAVLGAGPIGLLILELLRVSGAAEVYAADPLAHRRTAAEHYGATAAFDPETEDVVEAILDMTHGRGVDVAFEAAGAAETPDQSAAVVKPAGTVVVVGIPSDDELRLRHSVARRKGLTIKMSRRMKHTYPQTIALVQDGRVDVRSIVTHRFPLDQAVDAFRLADSYGDNVLKTVIEIGTMR